jgi:integrase
MATDIIGRYHLFSRKYTNKNGKHYEYWWYWWNENGERHQAPAGRACKLKRAAKDFLEEKIRQDELAAREGRAIAAAAKGVRFRDFAETLFLPGAKHLRRQEKISAAIKDSTRDGHRGRILNYLVPAWGDKAFQDFEADGFAEEFIDWLVDLTIAPRKRKETDEDQPLPAPAPISASLGNNLIETMSIVLREAKRLRLISRVPEFERFTRKSRRQGTFDDDELKALFPEEADALEALWKIEDHRDETGTGIMLGAAFCLAVSAGLRSGEVRAFHREQLIRRELPSGAMLYGLIIDRAYDAKMKLGMLKKGTEDDPRYRVVMIPDRTIKILDLWLERAPASGPVFVYHGHAMTKEHFLARFEIGLARAGIIAGGRRLTVHALRYTYNTRMRPLVSAEVLQEFVGHKSDEMTDHYDRPFLEARLLQLADNSGAVNRFWG